MRGAVKSAEAAKRGPDSLDDTAGNGTGGSSLAGLALEFRASEGAMLPLVETYYLSLWDAADIRGADRVDTGQLRFLLRGEGELLFADGRREPAPRVMLTAPGTAAAEYRARGPLRLFGISLRAIGWRALVGVPANQLADRAIDATEIFGPEVLALFEQLRGLDSIDAMIAAVEPMLRARRRPVPKPHIALACAVREWAASDSFDIEALYAAVPMSRRQVTRLCNEYYGGSPLYLRRKYRAINAAIRLRRGDPPADVASPFSDQSHMINEVKRFTGHTPTSLRQAIDPVLAAVLDRENFHELPEVFPETVDPDGL